MQNGLWRRKSEERKKRGSGRVGRGGKKKTETKGEVGKGMKQGMKRETYEKEGKKPQRKEMREYELKVKDDQVKKEK